MRREFQQVGQPPVQRPEVGTFVGFKEYQGGLCGQDRVSEGGYVGGEDGEVMGLVGHGEECCGPAQGVRM